MRVLSSYEKKKRGCQYCSDNGKTRLHNLTRLGCQHDECPYHVLDKYDTFEQFMASEDSQIRVDRFFQTAASDELQNGNALVNGIYKCGSGTNF